ncbi:MAG: hypothetical protein GY832_33505 [Chloroflexi bacterium]|nr:hypothetical protein [Chloroflexota bacterium]
MTNRVASLAGKKALVLSDNDTLFRVVELNLNKMLGMEVVKLAPNTLETQGIPAQNGNFDLIVVAISSPTGELVVSLIRAQLAERIRNVPLLIISDRLFRSDPEARIFHVDFPFRTDRFHDQVREILQSADMEHVM